MKKNKSAVVKGQSESCNEEKGKKIGVVENVVILVNRKG